jgi:hypothetical protein
MSRRSYGPCAPYLDPRAVFGRAFATARTVLDGVGPHQFDLPTPCDEFDVRALAGHLLVVAQRVRNVGRGESPFSVAEVVEADELAMLGITARLTA